MSFKCVARLLKFVKRCVKGVKGGGRHSEGGGVDLSCVTGVHLTVGYAGVVSHTNIWGKNGSHTNMWQKKRITKEGRQKVVDVFTKESRGEKFDTDRIQTWYRNHKRKFSQHDDRLNRRLAHLNLSDIADFKSLCSQ